MQLPQQFDPFAAATRRSIGNDGSANTAAVVLVVAAAPAHVLNSFGILYSRLVPAAVRLKS
jgi:hypothetical protein